MGNGHDLKTVHDRLERLQGIHFTDDHMGTVSLGSDSDTPPAPPIAAYHKDTARKEPIRGPDDAIDCALARAVSIVKEVFGIGIVDRYDGEL